MCNKVIKNIIGKDLSSKNLNELKYGTNVEMEHASTFKFIKNYEDRTGKFPKNKVIAKHIAKNHLAERKDYYSVLKKNKL